MKKFLGLYVLNIAFSVYSFYQYLSINTPTIHVMNGNNEVLSFKEPITLHTMGFDNLRTDLILLVLTLLITGLSYIVSKYSQKGIDWVSQKLGLLP